MGDIYVNEGEKKVFQLVPEDNHHSVCFGVWDIGFQKTEFKGEVKVLHRIIVGFEVSETVPETGKRFTIFKEYTASLNEKATLRKDLTSWRGREFTKEELKNFNISKLVGANCMLNVVHKMSQKGNAYSIIASVAKCPKGLPAIAPENTPEEPEWITKKAHAAIEPEANVNQAQPPVTDSTDEEIPF